MSPDEWGKDRLDDLAYQVRTVASLTTLVATHDAKIDGLGDDIDALREAHREFVTDSRRALESWNQACDRKVTRLESKIDEQARLVQANKWTPTQWAAILGPTFAAFVGLAAVLLGGGGG